MTPQELATFLREQVPSLKVTSKLPLTHHLLSALDAAVGLLRQALDVSDPTTDPWHPERRDKLLATLRLVVGEKEPA